MWKKRRSSKAVHDRKYFDINNADINNIEMNLSPLSSESSSVMSLQQSSTTEIPILVDSKKPVVIEAAKKVPELEISTPCKISMKEAMEMYKKRHKIIEIFDHRKPEDILEKLRLFQEKQKIEVEEELCDIGDFEDAPSDPSDTEDKFDDIEEKLSKSLTFDDLPPILQYDETEMLMNLNQKNTKIEHSEVRNVSKAEREKERIERKQRAIRENINKIFPPRCWLGTNGQLYRQQVSIKPPTRKDFRNLTETISVYMSILDASTNRYCKIRRQIYMKCFDEVIRLLLIENATNGFLLLRLRDEMVMTEAAWEETIKFAIDFSKNTLECDKHNELMRKELKILKTVEKTWFQRANVAKSEYDHYKNRLKELRKVAKKQANKKIEMYKIQQKQLQSQLESILFGKFAKLKN